MLDVQRSQGYSFPHDRHLIRLRLPQTTTLITGSDREAIDAVYDEGKRLVHLIIHTRQRALQRGK